ncbi:MAG: T9SS type A sorting domain-containing protein [Saprospiraceae bacterium]|nr:T9SS type A sorting domain-containing protein [Saprospiraceae bacterium]
MKNKFTYCLLLALTCTLHTFFLSAQAGSCLHFDGSNDNCQGTRRVSTDFTIEFWIKTSTAGNAGTQWYDGRGLCDSYSATINDDFGISILGNKVAFGVGNYNGADVTIQSTTNVTTGNWVHIAATRDQTTGQIKLYINGTLEATGTSSTNAISANPGIALGSVASIPNGTASRFTGHMDELRMWNRVLPICEIQNNKSCELDVSLQTGLVVYYKFNQGTAGGTNTGLTTLTDASGNSYNLTLTNFALTGTTSNWVSSGAVTTGTTCSAYTRVWTGGTSTDFEASANWSSSCIPSTIDEVVIPTVTNSPTLTASKTIKKLTFTGTSKLKLGNFDLTVNSISGHSSSAFVVTDGTGSLKVKSIPTASATTFPIGATTSSYDPMTVKPTTSTDFAVKVKAAANAAGFSGAIANFNKVAPRQWDITPSANAGSTILTLTNGGTTYTPTKPMMGHYNSATSKWEALTATHSAGTWTATTSSFSPFGVGDEGGFVELVLPVEIISFTGKNTEGGNLLTWTTVNETNNNGFEIQRSPQPLKGALTTWETLGFVAVKGKAATYEFTDKAPFGGEGLYRLRQIDNDGTETLSKVISIANKSNSKLIAYPNPAGNILTVEANTTDQFQIFNLLGQQVLNSATATRSGIFQTSPTLAPTLIDVSALPQGTYFLKVGNEQVKFMKQ